MASGAEAGHNLAMEVVVLKEGGFCLGVESAVEKALGAARENGKAYLFSPLVHNEKVNERLSEMGLEAIGNRPLEDLDPAYPIVLSAHGHCPALEEALRAKGFRFIDATCPFVLANELAIAREGVVDIIYIGHEGHEESLAALSFAKGKARLYPPGGKEEVPAGLTAPRVHVQTTVELDGFWKSYERIKGKYPDAVLRGRPCKATVERQEAIKGLTGDFDLIVVVGSSSSRNADSLLRTAKGHHPEIESHLISGPEEVPESWSRRKKAAVIGAASTAEEEIEGVAERLREI